MLFTGIAVKVRAGDDQLVLGFVMPQDLVNLKFAGLLGNANGDPDDDFQLPDGTVLSSDLSEEDIYYKFGEQCKYCSGRMLLRIWFTADKMNEIFLYFF